MKIAFVALAVVFCSAPMFAQAVQSAPADAGTPAPTTQGTPAPTIKMGDGKIRLYITDDEKSQSEFISIHRANYNANAQSSISGTFNHGSGTINGSSSASAHGSSATNSFGSSDSGPDPRTVEIEANFFKACPAITVTNDPASANYVLLFRRQEHVRSRGFALGGLTGLAISAGAKVNGASVFDVNGDLVFATRSSSVGGAIKDVCKDLSGRK